ncbi:hypothetical protein [Streptomyces sp. NPDC018833]|uniref:hypothetical protein n=1 Tax=Streptomyces sp. NPDC018833 TaxID=3365053 RepID=UPI0037954597
MWREDTCHDPHNLLIRGIMRKLVDGGRQIYNRIEAAGNLVGSSAGDLLARERPVGSAPDEVAH